MQVNLKKPRYILPLIALPFIILIFYAYQEASPANQEPDDQIERLQDQVADVSEEIRKRTLADKLDSYREQFRRGDGYTAIGQLQNEKSDSYRFDELYNNEEKQKLDSIESRLKSDAIWKTAAEPRENQAIDLQPQAERSLSISQPSAVRREPLDPMDLFRRQMAFADSMARANDPQERAALEEKNRLEQQEKINTTRDTLYPVKKYGRFHVEFNTVRPQNDATFIQAIIDEELTGYADSRLRLRLIDDLVVGDIVVRKGTYLFAHISGFSGQRVLLSISSILKGHKILPVKLDVYDLDGISGLFVPASAFREFTRETSGAAIQGTNIQQQFQGNDQMVMGIMQKMFQSTSTAISKYIRKNRVNLKYSTLVYLIDPSTLIKRTQ